MKINFLKRYQGNEMDKLYFYVSIARNSGYGYRWNIKYKHKILKRIKPKDLAGSLRKQYISNPLNELMNGYIGTKIGWRKWILVLDCDSEEHKNLATRELRVLNIEYKVIESSPGKFWVVCRYVNSFSRCISLMQSIPGVDQNYISECLSNRKIVLRAFPKRGIVPVLLEHFVDRPHWRVPLEPSGRGNKDPVWSWLGRLEEWWCSGEISWLISHQLRSMEDRWPKRKDMGERPPVAEVKEEKEEDEEEKKKEELKRKNRRMIRLEGGV